jgi:signal transduction histidine kinase
MLLLVQTAGLWKISPTNEWLMLIKEKPHMNERIKLLAEQAGYYLYDLTETHECKTVETDSTDEWITLEKFAELIVRECAEVASKVVVEHEGVDFGLVEACYKHFGVKE